MLILERGSDLIREARNGIKEIKRQAIEFRGIFMSDLQKLMGQYITAKQHVETFPMKCDAPALPLYVVAESDRHNECNDCAVKALTVATGKTYAECHNALRVAGRKNREGSSGRMIVNALNILGFGLCSGDYSGKTFTTFKAKNAKDVLLVMSKTHIVAATDGIIRDWSNGTRRRIVGCYKLYKLELSL